MTALQRPPALRSGDVIAIVPTARAIVLDEIRDGIALAESWGLRVKIGEGIGRKDFQQAGTAQERATDLQAALNDPSVRAIWCARGGYGTMQLMPHLDLSVLKRDPKWIVGFSDITVLHNHLQNMGLCSLHAQMAHMVGSKTDETRETLRCALFGEEYRVVSGEWRVASARDADARLTTHHSPLATQRAGTCEGVLIGGNLSLLYGLRGTPYDIDPKGKILFMEDLDELLYHMDRMVMNLKLSGWFEGLAGLVVGGMNDMHDKNPADPFGRTAEQIIANATKGTNYPVAFGFPAGHIKDNRALIMGEKTKLSVTANGATLSFGGAARLSGAEA